SVVFCRARSVSKDEANLSSPLFTAARNWLTATSGPPSALAPLSAVPPQPEISPAINSAAQPNLRTTISCLLARIAGSNARSNESLTGARASPSAGRSLPGSADPVKANSGRQLAAPGCWQQLARAKSAIECILIAAIECQHRFKPL